MQILSIVDLAYHTLHTFCNFVVKWAKMLAIFFRKYLYNTAYDYKWMLYQCRNTLQCVISYVKFVEDFAQNKYCSSNEQKTNFCRKWYAGSYLQVWRQTDENWHDSGPQMFRHTIFNERDAILWWLFEELLKVFTWLVGFPYQLSIIAALFRKHIANFRWKQAENLPCVVQ